MRKCFSAGTALAASLFLSACGGSGGPINSTPTPTPTPSPAPTPTPTTSSSGIVDPNISRAFSGTAATTQFSATTSGGITQATAQSRAALTVQYDAASKTYTLTSGPTTSAFGGATRQADRFAGEMRWTKTGSALSAALTIATQPYHGRLPQNRYVALGYWQENGVSGGVQQTQFSSFTFGSATASTEMPRTGTAHWLIDLFGLFLTPGEELRIISADGDFDVDFAAGAYTASAAVEQSDYISGGGVSGALYFRSGGQISSNGTFSGPFTYGAPTGLLTGSMTGSFYGPNADEVGAVFNAGGAGSTLTGSFTGQRTTLASSSDGVANVSLTAAVKTQRLFNNQTSGITYQTREGELGLSTAGVLITSGFGTITPLGVGEASVSSYGYTPDNRDLTPIQRANFDTYATMLGGDPTTISFYKIGSANSELALTYTSFLRWTLQRNGAIATGQRIYDTRDYFLTYGIKTPENMVTARSGTARYDGLAYGAGVDPTGTKYDVSGTSRFDVNFSGSSYSGSLSLNLASNGSAPTSLGTFNFSGAIGLGQLLPAELPRGGNWGGSNYIQPQFYGPAGQEIGATFQMTTGPFENANSLFIAGAAVAK